MFVDFQILWRYFAWFNQTLSVFTFWAITVYLTKQHKNAIITLIPALFMTYVCTSYILVAPEGLQLSPTLSYIIAGALDLGLLVWYLMKRTSLAS